MKEIYLAGGCFWGTQQYIKQIEGVIETEVGYANGSTPSPTYEEVYTDQTGYAETVRIKYDEAKVGLDLILDLYFRSIDPTSLNRQGADCGTRYRTGIYYTTPHDLPIIEQVYRNVEAQYNTPLAVEIEPLHNFYAAEEYHQDYLEKNPQGYCHIPRALIARVKELSQSAKANE